MHAVILKNDSVGDLTKSLGAINNITTSRENEKITIFLSKLSQRFSFLVKKHNVDIKILNYHPNIIEKIKLVLFLSRSNVKKVYILTPKNFYFFLPLIFRRIKFYAICINNINNYRRPNLFLRKFLYKFEVNHRESVFKRSSTQSIQEKLTSNINASSNYKFDLNIKKTKVLDKYLPDKYIYFHYKKKICDELNWGLSELKLLFNEFLNYGNKIVFTRDITGWDYQRGEKRINKNYLTFKDNFDSYDFKSNSFISNKSNILLLDNIVGEDLFNVIKYSQKIIAFHGMMTQLGYLLKKPVLDLWFCKINSWDDYRKYRNSFYEFKPKHKDYDFIIPSNDIKKTINKIKFSIKKCQKN